MNFMSNKKHLVFAFLMFVSYAFNKSILIFVWSNTENDFDFYYNLSFFFIFIQFILFPLIGLLSKKIFYQLFGIIGVQFHIINFWDNMMNSNCVNSIIDVTKYILIAVNSISVVLILIYLIKSKLTFNKILVFDLIINGCLILTISKILSFLFKKSFL